MESQTNTPPEVKEMQTVQLPPDSTYVQRAEERALSFANPKLWQQIKVMADAFKMAGALPATLDTVPKVVMALQAGYESGMQPIEALNSFYFVNGKLALYGEMAITQVIRAGHKVEWGKCDANEATVTITRGDNGATATNTFTMVMASARGLTKNGVYQKYPENMLKFKVFHMTSKFVCPDALHGRDIKEVAEETIEATLVPDDEQTIEVEAPTPRGKRKTLKEAIAEPEAQPEAAAAEAEPTLENLSDAEKKIRYEALIEKEMTGGKLTPKEKMLMGQYQAKKPE